MNRDGSDKKHKKNPMIELSDSINRSMIGDFEALAKGGCLSKIITLVIIIVGILMLSKCVD